MQYKMDESLFEKMFGDDSPLKSKPTDILDSLFAISDTTNKAKLAEKLAKEPRPPQPEHSLMRLLDNRQTTKKVQQARQKNMTVNDIRHARDLADFQAKNKESSVKRYPSKAVNDDTIKRYVPKIVDLRKPEADEVKPATKVMKRKVEQKQEKKNRRRERFRKEKYEGSYEKSDERSDERSGDSYQLESFIEKDREQLSEGMKKKLRKATGYNPSDSRFKQMDQVKIKESGANQIFNEEKRTYRIAKMEEQEDYEQEMLRKKHRHQRH